MTQKKERPSLIRLEPIVEILRAAIWSAKLADEKPVSILLIAKQESAKTECMKFFRGTSTLLYFSDLTGSGILHYKNEIESMKVRHFMLNDLTRVLSHSKGVGERTIQTLATLMEEGESESANPDSKIKWNNWPRIGVIMGITPEFYRGKAGGWRKTGFMSRFLPVEFHYRESTANQIHEHIRKGFSLPAPKPENLPEKMIPCTISQMHGIIIEQTAKELGSVHDTYGFRYHKALRRLAKGRAISMGRNKVNTEDVLKIRKWAEFFGGQEVVI